MSEQSFEANPHLVGPCLFGVPVPVRAFGFPVSSTGGYRRGERSLTCSERTVLDLTGSRDTSELMRADLWSTGARVVQLKRTAHLAPKAHKTTGSEVAAA